MATAAAAQSQSSSSITTYKEPVGPVVGDITHTRTTSPMANGTYTTNSISPGDHTSVQPYVGTSTYDPYPNRERAQTGVSVGIAIPLGGNSSRPTPSPSPTPRSNGPRHLPQGTPQ